MSQSLSRPDSVVAVERSAAFRMSQSASICVSKTEGSSCLYGWAGPAGREPSL